MIDNVIGDIKDNYKNLEKSIVRQLNFEVKNHHLTAGHHREVIWMDFFRQIIPMKFAIRQGVFLIDSKGEVSKEVDLAVFDEQYTPYIFNYGNIYFIPIEAVAMVIQCKSRSLNKTNVLGWLQSVTKLSAVEGGIARMVNFISKTPTTQKATKPITVLCCLENEFKELDSLDLFIKALGNNDGLQVEWNKELKTLKDCFLKFNGLDIESTKTLFNEDNRLDKKLEELGVKDNTILSLIFQLNQVLMLINNPMLFPHEAYVKMFNGASSK